jgi:hypothetical protein
MIGGSGRSEQRVAPRKNLRRVVAKILKRSRVAGAVCLLMAWLTPALT